MKFDDPRAVEQICYQMRLGDYPRSINRTRIDELFNGWPPYSDEEVQQNNIEVNVNYLEGTRIGHEARSQYYQAFLKPGNFFKASTDYGPKHKRAAFGAVFTKQINRIMKRSLSYFECCRSKFASNVLHGIAPAVMRDRDRWCPEPFSVGDILIPANTLLTMENLPFFAVYRSYTGPQLIKLTQGSKVDPGWNQDLIKACIAWIDRQTMALMGSNWPEIWSPEKAAERVKSDGGFYAGDAVPTIDVWDFYFWNDDDKVNGWNRRMILDSWSSPTVAAQATAPTMTRKGGDFWDVNRDQFLYNPKERKWATEMSEIVNFQFADLSAVSPFRYHSVRSLGFLIYSICHLQNRLRCKFNEAIFESLMMYFRVKSSDEAERALKVELASRGFIDESLQFIPASERFQVNANLVELGLRENAGIIAANSSSYTLNPDKVPDKREKTAFEVNAEVSNMTSLVSAALLQSYTYQNFEFREIARRFRIKGSRDPQVNTFQAACLKNGIPEKVLYSAECWDIEPERVMGGGNKALEMAIAQQLMQYRNLYDPDPQRQILRDVTLAITDDPARADQLVPEMPEISNTIHDTELVFAALMQNIQVTPKSGLNAIEVVATMLRQIEAKVMMINQTDGVGTQQDVIGLSMAAQYTEFFINKMAEDPNERDRVTEAQKGLAKLMNEVRAFAQRQQEAAQQAAQNGQQGMDPKDMAKIQGMLMQAQVKAENTAKSHAQRTAQRQVQWEMEMKRKVQESGSDQTQKNRLSGQELAANDALLQQELRGEAERLKLEQNMARESAAMDLARQRLMSEKETETPQE